MKKFIRLIILLISITTVLSGLVQLIHTEFILSQIGAEITPVTVQLFATIAMFMVLFGGLIIHALYSAHSNRAAFLWGALQKLGASIAVFIGIHHHLFLSKAALVASFDLLSAILFFIYLLLTKNEDHQ
ncbi:patatin [Pedobacter sp. L105]|uniref:patatin n=1 Tax=Pedobacter sp. L105 TaxID=1641871 RepID=UPI00131ABD9B|nr:patatin [Pedobacter sp. L105]